MATPESPPSMQDASATPNLDRLQQTLKQAGPQAEAPEGYTKHASSAERSMQDPSATPDLDRLQQMLKQAGPQAEAPEGYTKHASFDTDHSTPAALRHTPAYAALKENPKSALQAEPFRGVGGLDAHAVDSRKPNPLGEIIETFKRSSCSAGESVANVSCSNIPQLNTENKARTH